MSRPQGRPAVRRQVARAIERTIWVLGIAAASACRPPTGEAPVDAATLRVGVGQVATATPLFGVRQLMQLQSLESLVRMGEDGRAQPWLAEGWTVATDGLSMTIRLRKGVTFHDGTPVTSNVVVDILRKELPPFMGATFDDVAAIEAETDTTIHITFRRASPFLIEALEASIRKPNDPRGGTGPFIPDAGNGATGMHRNDAYYLGRPHIAKIAVSTFPNVRAAWAEMLRGGLDMLWEVGTDALDSLKGSTEIKTYAYVRHYQYVVAFNPKNVVLRSPDVRVALNEAVDRAAVIRDALDGHGVASTSLLWPSHWAFRSDLSRFAYDPQRAEGRLKRDGAKSTRGVRFTCLVSPEATDERVAVVVRRQLEAVGVTMDVTEAPRDQILTKLDTGDFDAVLFDLISAPSVFRLWAGWHTRGGMNFAHFGNADMDRMLDQVRYAASDTAYRDAIAGFQKYLTDDPPAIFLAWTERARAVGRQFSVPTTESGRDILATLRLWKPQTEDRRARTQ